MKNRLEIAGKSRNMSTQDKDFMNITVTTVADPQEGKQPENVPTADVVVVMDASGSMSTMGTEPVEAVNGFIAGQKGLSTDPDARLSLYTFDTKTTTVYEEKKLSEIEEYKEYVPGGMTALYECVHLAINKKLAGDRKKNVCMVVVTDGEENSSAPEYNKATLKAMITMVERDHNWKVIFLGANIDAFAEGAKIGTALYHCAQYNQGTRGDLTKLLRTTSAAVNNYRASAYSCMSSAPQDITKMNST